MDLLFALIPVIIFSLFALTFVLAPIIKKIILISYEKKLSGLGLLVTKRIITSDFYVFWYYFFDPRVGVWIDYASRKVAIRNSYFETSPRIVTFDDLENVEIDIEEPRVDTFKTSLTPWAREKTVLLAGKIKLRIAVPSIVSRKNQITLDLFRRPFFGRKESADSNAYQNVLKGSQGMYSELKTIINA